MPPIETGPRLLLVANQVRDFLEYRMPLARALRDAGFEVHVALPQEPGKEALEREGMHVHAIHLRRLGAAPWGELRTLVSLTRLYRRLHPDLVHHLCLKPVLYGGVAARLAGVPSVIGTLMGLGPVFTSRIPRMRVLRRLVARGLHFAFAHPNHRLVVQNPDDREQLIALGIAPAERTMVIAGSGVDLSSFEPTPEPDGPPVVLMASRLLEEKGVGEFVAAARELRRQGNPARFVLLGEAERDHPGAIPRSTIEAWHESGDVEWLGWRRDVPALMARSHIVCLPSYYGEGIPRVLIEAAAAGRPIVTTDSPGCREVVLQGQNGLLVPPRDVEALTAAIQQLTASASRRAAMGTRSREIAVARFALQRVLDANLALHRAVLGGADDRLGPRKSLPIRRRE